MINLQYTVMAPLSLLMAYTVGLLSSFWLRLAIRCCGTFALSMYAISPRHLSLHQILRLQNVNPQPYIVVNIDPVINRLFQIIFLYFSGLKTEAAFQSGLLCKVRIQLCSWIIVCEKANQLWRLWKLRDLSTDFVNEFLGDCLSQDHS